MRVAQLLLCIARRCHKHKRVRLQRGLAVKCTRTAQNAEGRWFTQHLTWVLLFSVSKISCASDIDRLHNSSRRTRTHTHTTTSHSTDLCRFKQYSSTLATAKYIDNRHNMHTHAGAQQQARVLFYGTYGAIQVILPPTLQHANSRKFRESTTCAATSTPTKR